MTEGLRNRIDYQCQINRLMLAAGQSPINGGSVLTQEEMDAAYLAYVEDESPESFVALVLAGREAVEASAPEGLRATA